MLPNDADRRPGSQLGFLTPESTGSPGEGEEELRAFLRDATRRGEAMVVNVIRKSGKVSWAVAAQASAARLDHDLVTVTLPTGRGALFFLAEATAVGTNADPLLRLEQRGEVRHFQRRKNLRVRCNLSAVVLKDNEVLLNTATVDISASGARIMARDDLAPGDRLNLRIDLGNEPVELEVFILGYGGTGEVRMAFLDPPFDVVGRLKAEIPRLAERDRDRD